VASILGAKIYMDGEHDASGSAKAVADSAVAMSSAIVLRMESQNQSLRNHYLKQKEEGENVEEAEEQLERLDYDRQAIVEMKHNIFGTEPSTDDR
jgi:hypothetical protein